MGPKEKEWSCPFRMSYLFNKYSVSSCYTNNTVFIKQKEVKGENHFWRHSAGNHCWLFGARLSKLSRVFMFLCVLLPSSIGGTISLTAIFTHQYSAVTLTCIIKEYSCTGHFQWLLIASFGSIHHSWFNRFPTQERVQFFPAINSAPPESLLTPVSLD